MQNLIFVHLGDVYVSGPIERLYGKPVLPSDVDDVRTALLQGEALDPLRLHDCGVVDAKIFEYRIWDRRYADVIASSKRVLEHSSGAAALVSHRNELITERLRADLDVDCLLYDDGLRSAEPWVIGASEAQCNRLVELLEGLEHEGIANAIFLTDYTGTEYLTRAYMRSVLGVEGSYRGLDHSDGHSTVGTMKFMRPAGTHIEIPSRRMQRFPHTLAGDLPWSTIFDHEGTYWPGRSLS